MSHFAISLAVLLGATASYPLAGADGHNTLSAEEAKGGWQLLFDGRTSEGWVEVTGKAFPEGAWLVEGGCLRVRANRPSMQDIRTIPKFRAFDLKFDWKLAAGGNSGVKYLLEKVDEWVDAAGRQARARGLEYQLADNANSDVGPYPNRWCGGLYSVAAPSSEARAPIGVWNQSRIVVTETYIEHWLNGVSVLRLDTIGPELAKVAVKRPGGEARAISLQDHGSETWFRNLKVRRLD